MLVAAELRQKHLTAHAGRSGAAPELLAWRF
jgi:hypothetical protein